jgi:hypothetical protein
MKINTTNMLPIDIYKLVLQGKLKQFPRYYWERPESLDNAQVIIKYLIEEVLKWNEKQLKENLDYETFTKNKLRGMLVQVFNDSPFKAIETAYPNKFKQWEFKHTPKNFWTKETIIEATKWMVDEKLKWSREDIIKNISKETFQHYGLLGALKHYRVSPYIILKEVYPNENWEELTSKLKQ